MEAEEQNGRRGTHCRCREQDSRKLGAKERRQKSKYFHKAWGKVERVEVTARLSNTLYARK